jgi:hypothetical protein
LGLAAHFQVADIRESIPQADIVFFDPARRDERGKRLYKVEHYQPPLSIIREWEVPSLVVKLSPGVDLSQLHPYSGGVEFVSVEGDLKEAVLWIGAGWGGRRATLLTHEQEHHWENETGEGFESPSNKIGDVRLSEPRGWLVESDPSLLRAGLVQEVAIAFGGCLLDETIAYFTADIRPESPWIRAWKILDWMPFNLKKLRAYLRERNVGQVTVKKRGSAITPEELIPQLKLKGGESRVLVLTRYREQPIVIICEDYQLKQLMDYG